MGDVDAIVAAVEGRPAQPEGRHNRDALHDFNLPAIVRGYIAIKSGNATETLAIEEAGMMPRLYASYQGVRVRVTTVSRLGDVGISRKDEGYGYFARVSIYDLTDFSQEMYPGAPAKRRRIRLHAVTSADGFWTRIEPGAGKLAEIFPSDVPVLFTESAKASRAVSKVDPYGLKGLKIATLLIEREKD